MAEEEKKEESKEEGQEGQSGKKGIIIIAIIAVVAIALSVGATMYFLGGDDSEEMSEEGTEEVEVVDEKGPAIYLDIKPPFLVTFNVNGRQRYMQIYVAVSSREQSDLDTLEFHMPLIRSKVIAAYGGQKFEDLQTDEGKKSLQSLTLNLVNEVLENEGAGNIEAVYFTNFVLQ